MMMSVIMRLRVRCQIQVESVFVSLIIERSVQLVSRGGLVVVP
jgi:hypothetical protein